MAKDWYKKCKDILQFHEEKCALQSKRRGEKWTIANTAKVLGLSAGYVSESIRLAQVDNKMLGELTRESALRIIKGNG